MTDEQSRAAGAFDELVKRAMRHFLASKNTGCMFARTFAKPDDGPLWWMILRGDVNAKLPRLLNGSFDGAAATSTPAIAVFPDLGTDDDIVRLLGCLVEDGRWTANGCAWDREADGALVGLHWRTSRDARASVLGLAPLWTLPLHRRAPYVSLVVWPGDHENKYLARARPEGEVSLIDMRVDHLMPKEGHRELWALSRSLTEDFRTLPFGGAARPDVAFCLPPTKRGALDAIFTRSAALHP